MHTTLQKQATHTGSAGQVALFFLNNAWVAKSQSNTIVLAACAPFEEQLCIILKCLRIAMEILHKVRTRPAYVFLAGYATFVPERLRPMIIILDVLDNLGSHVNDGYLPKVARIWFAQPRSEGF